MTPSRRAALSFALLTAPLLCCLTLPAASARAATTDSGRSASEARNLAEFQAISLAGSMDLLVRQGAQQVQVQADDKLLPLLETAVEALKTGPTLVVRWKQGVSLHHRSKVLVSVSLPRLAALATAGSGDVRIETFDTPALQLALSGSGDASLEALTTGWLDVRIAGSGDVTGKGTATRLTVNIAGSGDVDLSGLRADAVEVHIAGSGDVAVQAQKTLDVHSAGSGDVSYAGNPSVRSKVTGSGSVTRQ